LLTTGYSQWRFQDGHDREELEKSTRMLTAEEQALMDTEIVGKTGQKRKIEVRIHCFLYRRGSD